MTGVKQHSALLNKIFNIWLTYVINFILIFKVTFKNKKCLPAHLSKAFLIT